MLYTFNIFWRLLLGNLVALTLYNFAGFEITAVLILASMLILIANK
jgi:hypothetical protein